MSNYNWDDEFAATESGSDTEQNPMKELRRKYEALLKEHKEAKTRLTELESEIQTSSLTKLFDEFKFPEAARALYQETKRPATSEGVAEFIQKFGSVFGIGEERVSDDEAAARAAQERIAQASNQANPVTAPDLRSLDKEKFKAMDLEEFTKFATEWEQSIQR